MMDEAAKSGAILIDKEKERSSSDGIK